MLCVGNNATTSCGCATRPNLTQSASVTCLKPWRKFAPPTQHSPPRRLRERGTMANLMPVMAGTKATWVRAKLLSPPHHGWALTGHTKRGAMGSQKERVGEVPANKILLGLRPQEDRFARHAQCIDKTDTARASIVLKTQGRGWGAEFRW